MYKCKSQKGSNVLNFTLFRETLRDVINMLRNTSSPQVEYIIRTMKKWAKDNLVPVPWSTKVIFFCSATDFIMCEGVIHVVFHIKL